MAQLLKRRVVIRVEVCKTWLPVLSGVYILGTIELSVNCKYTCIALIRTHLENITSMATWRILREQKLGFWHKWLIREAVDSIG